MSAADTGTDRDENKSQIVLLNGNVVQSDPLGALALRLGLLIEESELGGGAPIPVDALLTVGDSLDALISTAKAVKQRWTDAMIRHINRYGRIEYGGDNTITWYVTRGDKKIKCMDVVGCCNYCLEVLDADPKKFADFVNLIAADGIKPGAAKKFLGAAYETFFVEEWPDRLQRDPPPEKPAVAPKKTDVLVKADTRFSR